MIIYCWFCHSARFLMRGCNKSWREIRSYCIHKEHDPSNMDWKNNLAVNLAICYRHKNVTYVSVWNMFKTPTTSTTVLQPNAPFKKWNDESFNTNNIITAQSDSNHVRYEVYARWLRKRNGGAENLWNRSPFLHLPELRDDGDILFFFHHPVQQKIKP